MNALESAEKVSYLPHQAVSCQIAETAKELCISKIDWDEEVPQDIKVKLHKWFLQVREHNNITVPRCISSENGDEKVKYYLHGFAEAIKTAYFAWV